MNAQTPPRSDETLRSHRLRARTTAAHQSLDAAISARDPFGDRERYGRFLAVQMAFHAAIDPLYCDPALADALPDLERRRRAVLVRQDMLDLGLDPAAAEADASVPTDFAAGLGWLYVAEGSNLGAAFLLKEAQKLGLSETFGARHLAAPAEGRGLSWRTFAAALDAAPLAAEDEPKVIHAAEAAFRRVAALVEAKMG